LKRVRSWRRLRNADLPAPPYRLSGLHFPNARSDSCDKFPCWPPSRTAPGESHRRSEFPISCADRAGTMPAITNSHRTHPAYWERLQRSLSGLMRDYRQIQRVSLGRFSVEEALSRALRGARFAVRRTAGGFVSGEIQSALRRPSRTSVVRNPGLRAICLSRGPPPGPGKRSNRRRREPYRREEQRHCQAQPSHKAIFTLLYNL